MAVEVEYLNANSINNINTNFQRTKEALIETLGRDGDVPNHMNSDLDMNSNDILNVGLIDAQDFTIDGVPINGALELAVESALAAEASAQNAAQSEADAQTAADEAEAALAEIEGIISGFERTDFATKALAEASSLEVAPLYIRIQSYANIGDNGGGLYRKAVSEPTHPGKLSITLQDTTVVWYELVEQILRPEQFGSIGVNTAGDTAAWVALVSVANSRGGAIQIRLPSRMDLSGTGVVNDSQTFTNFTYITIIGDTSFVYQRTRLAKSFKFLNTGGVVDVKNVYFVGYAEQQINASQTPDEIDFDSSSGNAVAAIYSENLRELNLERITTRNHAGRDIDCRNVLYLKVRDCDLVGLGPTYNRPIIDGHQGNGEDAAIYFIPVMDGPGYYNPSTSNAYKQRLEIHDSKIRWHSFCVRTILNEAIILHGNYFGETPGQHHIYDTDSDGHDVVGNIFENCRQIGYKMQFENLAGFYYGAPYDANKPGGYAVGDVVRAFSIAWICKTAYDPAGAPFSSTNWNEHPRNSRRGGIWEGNQFKSCAEAGIGIIESSNVDGRNIWSRGYIIEGNYFDLCGNSLYLDRCWRASIRGNNFQRSTQYDIFGRSFHGIITDNDHWETTKNCVIISLSKTSTIESNRYNNYGLGGTTDQDKVAVVIYAPNGATAPPSNSTGVRLFFRGNSFIHIVEGATTETTDAPGPWLVLGSDARVQWEIENTTGTPTTKLFNISAGSVPYQFRNHFVTNTQGFVNTAQNPPSWTLEFSTDYNLEAGSTLSGVRDVLGTFISNTLNKRVR